MLYLVTDQYYISCTMYHQQYTMQVNNILVVAQATNRLTHDFWGVQEYALRSHGLIYTNQGRLHGIYWQSMVCTWCKVSQIYAWCHRVQNKGKELVGHIVRPKLVLIGHFENCLATYLMQLSALFTSYYVWWPTISLKLKYTTSCYPSPLSCLSV